MSFLMQFRSGARLESYDEQVVTATKILQRKSTNFKQAWANYCGMFGGGKNDPMKHDAEFHIAFYDSVCGQIQGKEMTAPPSHMMGMEPPSKMMRMSPPGGSTGSMASAGMMGMGMGMDLKSQLVSQIKSFQRMGDQQKQYWWDHCDQMLGGVRDPAKHDVAILQNFVDGYGVANVLPAKPMPSMSASMGMGMSTGMGAGMGGVDTEKMSYVQRVKAYQRADPLQKQAWDEFCNSIGDMQHTKNPTKDPMRHDTQTLMDFITTYNVP